MTGTTRAASSATSTGAWPGRVDSPPTSRMSAPSATIRRAAATATRDRVVGRTGEEAVARERVRGDVEDAHDERPRAPGEVGRPDRVVERGGHRSRRSLRVAQERVVHGPPRSRPGTASRRRRSGPSADGQRRVACRPGRSVDQHATTVARRRAARQRAGEVARPAAPAGRRAAVADDRGVGEGGGAGPGRPRPRRRPCPPSRPSAASIGPADEERPQVVERVGERRRAGRVVRAVEQHLATVDVEQLEPARPARRSRSPPVGRRRATRAIPAASSASSRASATATLAAWWRPRSPTRVRPSRAQVDLDPVAVPAERAGPPARPRSAARRAGAARRRMTASASPVAPGHRDGRRAR